MSFRPFHRLAVSTLVLAFLLAMASPPAQASQKAGLLDTLGTKVQIWLAAWLPGWAGIDNAGLTAPNGSGHLPALGRAAGGGRLEGSHRGGPGIKPACDNSGSIDPNGGCPP
jgi:hypothetical protein